MINLFDFLKNYRDNSSNMSYGDILLNESSNNVENMLSRKELEIYKQVKKGDKLRLNLSENKNLIDEDTKISRQPQNISGIGKVVQIC